MLNDSSNAAFKAVDKDVPVFLVLFPCFLCCHYYFHFYYYPYHYHYYYYFVSIRGGVRLLLGNFYFSEYACVKRWKISSFSIIIVINISIILVNHCSYRKNTTEHRATAACGLGSPAPSVLSLPIKVVFKCPALSAWSWLSPASKPAVTIPYCKASHSGSASFHIPL